MSQTALDELADLPRWVAWRNEERGGKPTKIPYAPNGRHAKADDPTTWGTRVEADEAAMRLVNGQGGGTGIQLGDVGYDQWLAGMDFDACIDAGGKLADWAAALLAAIPSYAERSPSGTGVKSFFYVAREDVRPFLDLLGVDSATWGTRRTVGTTGADHGPAVEIYCGGRYFAVTGLLWEGQPDRVALLDLPALEHVAALVPPARSTTTTDRPKGDDSRSAIAFRKAIPLRQQGKTFDEMCEALRADPETAEWYLEKGLAASMRELKRIWEKTNPLALALALTEQGLGLELIAKYPNAMRYTAELAQWHLWDGNLWRRDVRLEVFTRAQKVCRDAARHADTGKQAKELLLAKTRAAAVALAREHPDVATTATEWNQNPWLAGTPGGTVALRTGLLHPSNSADLISRAVRAVPGGDCPLWHATINEIFGGDEEVIKFAQRLAGYCLTADVSEEILLFLWGTGGNGKGTFLETILYVMGDYATTVPINTLVETLHKDHPTEIAKLHTMRMVVASETDTNARWNTARLKLLTGGDQLTGRWMRTDFFDFMPTHKLIISGNNKPTFGKVDEAIRRRLVLWPFTVRFANPDKTLKVRLRAEAGGILAWMIEGCVDWQQSGLQVPTKLTTATEQYLAEADDISRFIEECCVWDEPEWIKTSTKELYIAWAKWCQDGGIPAGSQRDFTERMKERFEITKGVHNLSYLKGVRRAREDEV